VLRRTSVAPLRSWHSWQRCSRCGTIPRVHQPQRLVTPEVATFGRARDRFWWCMRKCLLTAASASRGAVDKRSSHPRHLFELGHACSVLLRSRCMVLGRFAHHRDVITVVIWDVPHILGSIVTQLGTKLSGGVSIPILKHEGIEAAERDVGRGYLCQPRSFWGPCHRPTQIGLAACLASHAILEL
jgi:hypothetical protein